MPPLPHPVWAGVVVASRRVEWTSAGVAWPVPCGIFYKVIHLDKHIAGRRLVTASCMLRETTRRVVRGWSARFSIYVNKRLSILGPCQIELTYE